jgi:hypothetical protein
MEVIRPGHQADLSNPLSKSMSTAIRLLWQTCLHNMQSIYSVTALCWYNTVTSLQNNSTNQQPCRTTARSNKLTCVCDRHMHSGMQLDARTLWRPCSARNGSSKHCSDMASAPASATRGAAVIGRDLVVWGTERH